MTPVQLPREKTTKLHDIGNILKKHGQVQQNLRANVVSYGAAVAAAKATKPRGEGISRVAAKQKKCLEKLGV